MTEENKRKIRFSCHSENFGQMPMAQTFEFIRKLDYECVDVAARSLAPQQEIAQDPDAMADKMCACAAEKDLALSELFLSAVEVDGKPVDPACLKPDHDAAYFRQFECICRFASRAGFSSIMGAPGQPQTDMEEETCLDNAAKVLQKQAQIARTYGLAFHVEPTRTSVIRRPEAALRMIRLAPDLRYTLDLLHFHVNGVLLQDALTLLPWAGHLHIRQAKMGIGKCPVEEGEIDYDAVARAIAQSGWRGDVCSEFWCDGAMLAAGIRPVEQNIVLRYQFERQLKQYGVL